MANRYLYSVVVVLISAFRCRIQMYIVRTAHHRTPKTMGQRLRHSPAPALSLIVVKKLNSYSQHGSQSAKSTFFFFQVGAESALSVNGQTRV